MDSSVQERLKKLREPFPTTDIEWRVGQMTQDRKHGRALPYLRFHAVADRLDDVLGPENWTPAYVAGPAGGVVCRLSFCLDGVWVTKENGAENTDLEAVKGGLTDAFKRACAMWGIGRYLYAYSAPWVALDEVRRLTSVPRLPDHMLPESERGAQESNPAAANETAGPAAEPAAEPASEPASEPVAEPVREPASNVTELPVRSTAERAPDAGPRAAAERPAQPVAEQVQAAQPEASGFPDLPEGLSDSDINKVRDILARAQKDVSINVLKNYVNGKGKESMSEPARKYLLVQLDKFAA